MAVCQAYATHKRYVHTINDVENIVATVQQIWDRNWYQIVSSLFWAWYQYQYFFFLVRKSIVLYLDLRMKKKLSLFFSFFLQYGPISCVSNNFLVGSVIWDNTEYFLTFQRWYVYIVSGKWDNTNTVFLGIQILRQYSVLGDTVSSRLCNCTVDCSKLVRN
jgi:hypothetical protein